MKNLIVFFVLMVGASSISYAMQKNACEAKRYDIGGGSQKFMYCAGIMDFDEEPLLGTQVAVSVEELSHDSSPYCSHIKRIFVNNKVEKHFKSHSEKSKFSACLIPRDFADGNQNAELHIGDIRLYDPKLYHRNLILRKFIPEMGKPTEEQLSNLHTLHRARLKELKITLPGDEAVCFPPTTKVTKKISIKDRILNFYEVKNDKLVDFLEKNKDATCHQVLDALSIPSDILPPSGTEICAKETSLCNIKTISERKKPANPILKVINANLSSLGASFPFNQYLDTLEEPYADVLDLDNTEVTYKQADFEGKFRE